MDYLPLFIAGIISFIVALSELLTSRYPNTWHFFILKSGYYCLYCAIFALISSVFLGVLLYLGETNRIQFTGVLANPYLQAIAIGISTKAILQMNLYSARIGSISVPIGLETIKFIFEPYFLNQIDLDEYNFVKGFVDEKSLKYRDLQIAKEKILHNVPKLEESEWKSFKMDIENTYSVNEAMEVYLRNFGKKNFLRLFP